MLLQQTQNADELSGSVTVLFSFQASPDNPKAHWQVPLFEGLCVIEASRLAFQQSEIMQWFVMKLFLTPVTFVPGDQPVFED